MHTEEVKKTIDQKSVYCYKDRIVVRLPSFDEKNEGQLRNLVKILKWVLATLGYKENQLYKITDDKLGKTVALPAKIERMMDLFIFSFHSPVSTLERIDFGQGKLKANLVELIAALRVLKLHNHLIRKSRRDDTITQQMLRETFNVRAGLKETGTDPWLINLVKGVLAELTKVTQPFPGSWIHTIRDANKVKSNIGLLGIMGWVPRVANPTKIQHILLSKTREEETTVAPKQLKSKAVIGTGTKTKSTVLYRVDDANTPEGITHREFRLGASMLLPFLNPKSNKSIKDQLSVDPLSIRKSHIVDFYNQNQLIVDACNLAYANRVASERKDSKATPRTFSASRGRAVTLSKDVAFMDYQGIYYPRWIDVPDNIREGLQKLLHRKVREDDSSDDEAEEHEATPQQTEEKQNKEG
jgi:hypothetical protein